MRTNLPHTTFMSYTFRVIRYLPHSYVLGRTILTLGETFKEHCTSKACTSQVSNDI